MGEVVNELVYASYKANRDRNPEVTPERWRLVYQDADVDALEARYQREKGRGDRGNHENDNAL